MIHESVAQEMRVLLGVRGWDWPVWAHAFFPEGMPHEWRLTYFNTQFECVWLPASQWQALPTHEYARWAGDTHDTFLFLLQSEGDEPVPQALRGRARCIARDDARLVTFDKSTDLKKLAEIIMQFQDEPVYLISQDGDLPQLERVRTLLDLLGRSA